MSNFFKNPDIEKVIVLLVLIAYLIFQFPFLRMDLWNDEIYTLKYFTLVSPLTTVTDYHAPNNHILFNLINNFFLRMIGEKSVYTIMEHTWVLRIVSLLYSFGAVFFTFKLAEKISSRATAILSIVFLCSSVPFYNYAVEIRGYSLSIFLLTAISYYLFCYLESPLRKLVFILIILIAASIYTIPLNLYPVISMCVFLFLILVVSIAFSKIEKANSEWILYRKKSIVLIGGFISGVLLSLLLYAGIYKQVFYNEYVIPDAEFSHEKWIALIKEVFVFFFSYRYWILPLLCVGLGIKMFLMITKKGQTEFIFFIFLLCMLLVPFAISYARKDAPPDRTFINLIPFFAMLMAWLADGIFTLITDRKLRIVLLLCIGAYCFVNLQIEMNKVDDHMLNDIRTSGRSHNLYYNYYLAHFKPLSVVKKFNESVYKNGDFVVIHDSEPHDLPEYLAKYNIPFHDFSLVDSVLKSREKVYLFSRYPGEIESNSFLTLHQCNVRLISDEISYHNVLELERIKNH